MGKILNYLKNIIIIAYIVLIIFVTICLLSYNDFKVTVIGNTTLLPVIDEDLEADFNKGDLLLIERNRLSTIKEGDEVFFYRKKFGETTVNYAPIKAIDRVSANEFTYTIDGDYRFSSTNFIGKVETTTIVPKVGTVMSVLESKWGFLFLGVFPSLVAFFFTLYSVIQEATAGDEEDDENEKTKKKKKKSKKNVEEKKEVKDKVQEDSTKDVVAEKVEEVKEESKETVAEVIEEKNEKTEEKAEESKEEKTEAEEKTETEVKVEIKEENKEESKVEEKKEEPEKQEEKQIEEKKNEDDEAQKKKAAIEARMKSMTEEEKKALIKAKLDSMTDEEKRALIEAKKKKIEAEKNKKGDQ